MDELAIGKKKQKSGISVGRNRRWEWLPPPPWLPLHQTQTSDGATIAAIIAWGGNGSEELEALKKRVLWDYSRMKSCLVSCLQGEDTH